jgi:hypothetical protein
VFFRGANTTGAAIHFPLIIEVRIIKIKTIQEFSLLVKLDPFAAPIYVYAAD